MKANELRIGNYLNGKQGHVTVTEIRANNSVKIHDNTSSFYVGTCLQPIPLTEEWLIKFGFEWKNHGLRKSSFCIRQYGGGCSIFMSNESFNFNIELKYVHQLQNLYFALTGKLLTFKSE